MKTALMIIFQLAASGTDAYYTNRGAERPYFVEHNVIIRPFIKSTPSRVAFFSAGAAGKIVVPILLRKRHRERFADALALAGIVDNAEGATYTATH
jgi:hypothetical protein